MSRLPNISPGQPVDALFLTDMVASINSLYDTQITSGKNANISGNILPTANLSVIAFKQTISASGTSVPVGFGTAKFAAPPIVTATIDSSGIASTNNLSVSVQSITTGGCNIVAKFDTGVASVVVNVIAIGYPSATGA
jgi:hypothetical protein